MCKSEGYRVPAGSVLSSGSVSHIICLAEIIFISEVEEQKKNHADRSDSLSMTHARPGAQGFWTSDVSSKTGLADAASSARQKEEQSRAKEAE